VGNRDKLTAIFEIEKKGLKMSAKKVILKLRGEDGYSRTLRMSENQAVEKLRRWTTDNGKRFGHIKKLKRR